MKKSTLLISTLAIALLFPAGYALAADQVQDQERVYGSQLMTQQERAEYSSRMRAATNAEEREQVRKEHHERMKERAKERGMALPDEPPTKGGGMGSGGGRGPGGGMGSGGGMGQGGGGGRGR